MKRINYLFISLFCILTIGSCNEWLSVNPKTEVTKEEAFKTEKGFMDALIGCYIELKSQNAYGYELTMMTTELLVNAWDVEVGSENEAFTFHNYSHSGCENRIKTIYLKLFNIVAATNAILNHIDQARNNGVFKTEKYYEIVKGEALGIRAMCHLDLLRLFGPVPVLADDKKILPYVTKLSNRPDEYVSYNDYCTLLLNDFKNAADLLRNIDPILGDDSEDDFLDYRHFRVNYNAVKALEARAYLYMGKKSEALKAASEVINALSPDETSRYKLGVMSDIMMKDYLFRSELIFSIQDFKKYETYNLFATGQVKKGTDKSAITNLYGNTGTDIRELYMWEVVTQSDKKNTCVHHKHYATNVQGIVLNTSGTPIIRLSEIYLILAETAPIEEAQHYWSEFCKARHIVETILTEGSRTEVIMKEYRKEFYAEGQTFFCHKRLNSPSGDIIWFPSNETAKLNYVLPLPKTEIIHR